MREAVMQELRKTAVRKRLDCRNCGSEKLESILSLGEHYVVDFVTDPTNLKKPRAPLNLVICTHCRLVQLQHSVNPDVMFREFWYRSGINEMMRSALADIAIKASEKAKLQSGDLVLDIGTNDGTLLEQYPVKDLVKVGVDPSHQIKTVEAMSRMTFAFNGYFDVDTVTAIMKATQLRKFKVITCIAMFYDLENPTKFLHQVKAILDDDGVFVIQMNYLKTMIEKNAFDNIGHEHLNYYSFDTLTWLTSKCGLQVIDVEENDVNGGSLRVYFKKLQNNPEATLMTMEEKANAGYNCYQKIEAIRKREESAGLHQKQTYLDFGKRIERICTLLSEFIIRSAQQGKPVWVYGASTRGSTLLQSLQPVSLKCIPGAAERDENKYGRYTAGSWLKIVPEEEARRTAKMFLVCPWHFKDGILKREEEWMRSGGKMVLPLPEPVMYEIEDGELKASMLESVT